MSSHQVIQTEPFASAAVVSALNELRFQLGLVNVTHLGARLGAQGTSRSTGEATQLLCAWAVRRLSSGLDPQSVADSLVAMRERLPGSAGDALPDVLAFFCLDGRPTHTHTTVTEDVPARPRTLSRLSIRTTKRRTLPIPQWLSSRPSPNAKLPPLELERRPSLPTLLLPATPPRSDGEPGPRLSTPTSDTSSPCSTPGAIETPSFSTTSLPSYPTRQPSPLYQSTPDLNSLGLSDCPNDRIILVDHLLTLRYRLGADADGWFLGIGRDKAADLLIGVEAAGDTNVKEVVAQLRYAFGLPLVIIPISRTPSPAEAAMPFHQRDESFDLEQYLDDIIPLGEDGKSTPGVSPSKSSLCESPTVDLYSQTTPPASPLSKPSSTASPIVDLYTARASISTISSVVTTDSSATLTSLSDSISVSAFSIHEARRELPMSAKATAYRVPDRAIVDAVDEAGFPSLLPPLSYPRNAKSMPNVNDTYTRMPDRRRRPRSTKDFRLLPPFDLEAHTAQFVPSSASESSHSQLGCSSTLVKGYTFPPRKSPAASAFPDKLSPRRPSLDDGDRSRRQKFRQCVIVDGARVSPHASPQTAPQDATALGAILALFHPGADSGTDAVERALLQAVKNEEQRLAAMGEVFDAEARARLAWLLEQVGQEVSSPNCDTTDARSPAPISSAPSTACCTPSRPPPGHSAGHRLPTRSPRRATGCHSRPAPRRIPSRSALSFHQGSTPAWSLRSTRLSRFRSPFRQAVEPSALAQAQSVHPSPRATRTRSSSTPHQHYRAMPSTRHHYTSAATCSASRRPYCPVARRCATAAPTTPPQPRRRRPTHP